MKRKVTRGLILGIVVALVVAMAIVAVAQQATRGDRPERQFGTAGRGGGQDFGMRAQSGEAVASALKERVGITEEQAVKIEKLYDETQVSIDEITEELRNVTRKRTEGIAEILGPEKAQQSRGLLSRGMVGMAGMEGRGQMSFGGDAFRGQVESLIMGRIAEGLQLTDEQKAKAKQIEEAKAEKIKAANDKALEEFKAILTSEQLEQYDAFMSRIERGGGGAAPGERGERAPGMRGDRGERPQRGEGDNAAPTTRGRRGR